MSDEQEQIWKLVLEFFGGDGKKTRLWFDLRNPWLGGLSPTEMIALGRGEKLLRMVEQRLAEHEADPR